LKEKPGLDFLTNTLGSGVVCSIAGWTLARPILEYPVFWGVLSIFGVGGIFIPTTMIDYDSDLKNGVITIATSLGKIKALYIGMICVIVANIMIILMGLFHYIISPEFLLFTWPIMVAEIGSYWFLLRRMDFTGGYYAILAFSLLMAVGNAAVLLYNAGLLAIP
jgi:4-hydroxybenzoate polyprenyltransferase